MILFVTANPMTRTILLLTIAVTAACNSSAPPAGTTTAAPAAAAAPAASAPVTYGAGFFNAEKDDTGLIWHWMGQEGTVTLPNTGRDAKLHIRAGAPVANAVLRLDLNGQRLDEFTMAGGDFEKEYQVPAARLGNAATAELHMVASEVMAKPEDPRKLGLRVFSIDWSTP